MANIKLIYFGSVMDVTGIPGETADGVHTTDELNKWLVSRYPGLMAVTYRTSVNRQFVSENSSLADGDEVALLPPFAGG